MAYPPLLDPILSGVLCLCVLTGVLNLLEVLATPLASSGLLHLLYAILEIGGILLLVVLLVLCV